MRRGFGIRGGIATQLDETVVPTCSVLNLDGAPFRTNGQAFSVGAETAALAANFSSVTLNNDANISEAFKVVLQAIIVTNPNAGAATFLLGFSGVRSAFRIGRTQEFLELATGNLSDAMGQLALSAGSAQLGAPGISFSQFQVIVPGNSSLLVPLDITLLPQTAWAVETTIVLSAVTATFMGRAWRTA